jgi:transposase InsO family protein
MSRPQEIIAAGLVGVLSAPAAVEPWSCAHSRHRRTLRTLRPVPLTSPAWCAGAGLSAGSTPCHEHIYWLWTGLDWSCDATEYGEAGWQIIPVQDLASRYRFRPLVSDRLNGRQIAAHLESLFRQHGAPLFLKRDNGSPFNNQYVDAVMARFGVMPLNNPPHFPRYNGAEEKGIRDLKSALDQRQQTTGRKPKDFAMTVEVTAHDLNHRSRRCLL